MTPAELNQKVNLLVDLGEFPKPPQAKFKNFMKIRNKFFAFTKRQFVRKVFRNNSR